MDGVDEKTESEIAAKMSASNRPITLDYAKPRSNRRLIVLSIMLAVALLLPMPHLSKLWPTLEANFHAVQLQNRLPNQTVLIENTSAREQEAIKSFFPNNLAHPAKGVFLSTKDGAGIIRFLCISFEPSRNNRIPEIYFLAQSCLPGTLFSPPDFRASIRTVENTQFATIKSAIKSATHSIIPPAKPGEVVVAVTLDDKPATIKVFLLSDGSIIIDPPVFDGPVFESIK